MKTKLIFFFILIIFYGCSTSKINYNRNKIVNKYSENYLILLDNERIDIGTVYLDKDNIKSVIINKKSKTLNISQFEKRELIEIKKLNLDSLSKGRKGWNSKKIELIVLDGMPLSDSLIEKITIDPNSIKSFEIVSESTLNTKMHGKRFDGDLLLITTK